MNINLTAKVIKPANRRELLISDWMDKGFSPELIKIASETAFVRSLTNVKVVEVSDESSVDTN